MIFNGNDKEYFQLEIVGAENSTILTKTMQKSLTVLWFDSGANEYS